jgi:aminoglycoside phosphotransferase (APT) family kinase protein
MRIEMRSRSGTLESELLAWLIQSGFPDDIELTAMNPGLGSTEMWSFSPSPGASPLVVRVFAERADAAARREREAMVAAAHHGLPVPLIALHGTVEKRPLLVTTFLPGRPASLALAANPGAALALGVSMGQTLGNVHQIPAPEVLVSIKPGWIEKGGPSLTPIRHLLDAVARQDRLLHLDYHLNNVLIDGGQVSGVIDWENTAAGPPHMDLARSQAILRAMALAGLIPASHREAFDHFERGFAIGHAEVAGVDPHPALSAAWGLAMTVEDLANQLGKADGWLTQALLDQLVAERDKQIQMAREGQ